MNLNLLVALDALLKEQSVSRAAKKIFLTQAAVSIILKQLREIFNDELLVRKAKTMVATPFAIQLAPKVEQILGQIQGLTDTTEAFNPLTSNREFKLYVSEYIEFVILSYLYEYILQHAPNIKLNVKRISEYYDSTVFTKEIEELYLGPIEINLSKSLQSQKLFTESFVLVGHKDHQLMTKKITLANYKRAKYIIGERIGGDEAPNELRTKFKKLCLPAENITLVPHIATAIYLAEKTNLVTVLPKKLALNFIRGTNLICQELPFLSLKVDIFQVWPRRLNNDLGLRWLLSTIKQITLVHSDGKKN